MKYNVLLLMVILFFFYSCSSKKNQSETNLQDTVKTDKEGVVLPPPHHTKSVKNFSKVTGWPEGKTPIAPEGFKVTKFAGDLRNPRWIYIGANGDVFVSEATSGEKVIDKIQNEISGKDESQNLGNSANRITMFRDTNDDGIPEEQHTFLSDLNQPFGMLIMKDGFFVANTDGIWRYPYQAGQNSIKVRGEKILNLPTGGYNNHWTRNIIANADNTKIFVAVGSASNNGEYGLDREIRRANILEINPDGSDERVYAAGLRNPVGIDLQPGSYTLWAAVNERDDLGDDLVPDYLTSVKPGGFYGWPFTYFGKNDDPLVKEPLPDSINDVIVPDVALDAHSASLGFTFYDAKKFPGRYHNGAFIGQHGSWNRSAFTGYKVVFIPFVDGKPGSQEDFLTGFIKDEKSKEVYGRPVGVAVTKGGSLLVADDAANTIWHVSRISN